MPRRQCPDCKGMTEWDEIHHPNAWRHTDTNSRWCEPRPGAPERADLNYPTDCQQSPRPGSGRLVT